MRLPATIAQTRQETPTVKSFLLDLGGRDLPFHAGQWVDCYSQVDGQTAVGGYSITSSPLQHGAIELAVKRVGQNPVMRYLHESARVGDRLVVDGGHGDFYFQRGMADSLALIGGGIGITPLMSIVRYALEAAPEAKVLLVHSARTASELLFHKQLEAMAAQNSRLRCVFTVTQPDASWKGRAGRIDAALLRDVPADPRALFYVCGPDSLTESVVGELLRLGVSLLRIKFERWW